MKNFLYLIGILVLSVCFFLFTEKISLVMLENIYQRRLLAEFLRFSTIVLTCYFLYQMFSVSNKAKILSIISFHKTMLVKGLLFGGGLVLSVYLISRAVGVISVDFISGNTVLFLKYLLFLFITMTLTAIWEEILFRGVILFLCGLLWREYIGAVASAFVFGLIHLLSPLKSYQMVLSATVAGLLLNFVFLRVRNLWYVIGIHFSWNFFGAVLYSKKFMNIEYLSPFWSGKRGFEEGAIAITMCLIAWCYVAFQIRRNKSRVFLCCNK